MEDLLKSYLSSFQVLLQTELELLKMDREFKTIEEIPRKTPDENFQERLTEVTGKLQSVIGNIIGDIAKTEEGRERLRKMHEFHEKNGQLEMKQMNSLENITAYSPADKSTP